MPIFFLFSCRMPDDLKYPESCTRTRKNFIKGCSPFRHCPTTTSTRPFLHPFVFPTHNHGSCFLFPLGLLSRKGIDPFPPFFLSFSKEAPRPQPLAFPAVMPGRRIEKVFWMMASPFSLLPATPECPHFLVRTFSPLEPVAFLQKTSFH